MQGSCKKAASPAAFLFILFNVLFSHALTAAGITGNVKDSSTHEPLIGATVYIKELNRPTSTNLEGAFRFNNIPAGTYHVICQNVGFKPMELVAKVSNDDVVKLNFELPEITFDAVTVKGKMNNESDQGARKSERTADNVINVMSAQSIQLLPDITVANVMQRMSGVSIERNSSGDGQYAIVRGMDKRYNYTLVNGIKIPSPDDKNRYVPMDLFPSEMLQKLEVIKALTPSMEGDAIGGAVNLVMRDAPDYLTIKANVATGISQYFFTNPYYNFDSKGISFKSPEERFGPNYAAKISDFPMSNYHYSENKLPLNSLANLVIGNRFFHNRLGVIFSGGFQNTFKGTNSMFLSPNAQPAPGNIPAFEDIYIRTYSTQATRYGLHAKLDYVINEHNKIDFYTVYFQMNEKEYRHTIDSAIAIQRTGPGSGRVNLLDRSRIHDKSIYNATLQGTHDIIRNLSLNWSAVYSIASSIVPDWGEFQVTQLVQVDSNHKQQASPFSVLDQSRIWMHNTDKDLSGYLNLNYNLPLFRTKFEFSAGGMYRHKTRNNYYDEYHLSAPLVDGLPQQYSNVDNAVFVFEPSSAAYGSNINPNTYTSTENVTAGYVQLKFVTLKKLQVLGGIREELTDQHYETVMPSSFVGKSGSRSYPDILPSLHLKYMINKKQNLRFSYFHSLARPGFFEVIPYMVLGEYFNEQGNVYLKRTIADNFDLRYELFPKGSDQILAGVFYKNIQDPIEYSFVRHGPSGLALMPNNFGTAINYGFEFVITKYKGNFGVNANYTYTHSSITTDKNSYIRDANGNLTNITVQQTRPLQGQAAHVANLSLIYKNTKKGIDAQVALVYTGRNIIQVSNYYNLDYWQKGNTQLDFSFEKTINKRFSVYGKATNLLNTPMVVEVMQPNTFRSGNNILPDQTRNDRITVQKDYYMQSYFLGIRYKL